jgi:holo-[acyl-carrier protein] synthase
MNGESVVSGAGIGMDLVAIARFTQSLEHGGQAFLERIFTAAEQLECTSRPHPAQHYAARFAAKEAGMKALGCGWSGGVTFTDFEVVSDGSSVPKLLLHGKALQLAVALGITELALSLSHTDATAGAFVVAR